VTSFSVTKFLPGQQTITLASTIFMAAHAQCEINAFSGKTKCWGTGGRDSRAQFMKKRSRH